MTVTKFPSPQRRMAAFMAEQHREGQTIRAADLLLAGFSAEQIMQHGEAAAFQASRDLADAGLGESWIAPDVEWKNRYALRNIQARVATERKAGRLPPKGTPPTTLNSEPFP